MLHPVHMDLCLPYKDRAFHPKDHFKLGPRSEDRIPIEAMSSSFYGDFLTGPNGKVEDDEGPQNVGVYDIAEILTPRLFFEAYGNPEALETSLYALYCFLSKHPQNFGRFLLKNGKINSFFVRNQWNKVRYVGCLWKEASWVFTETEDPLRANYIARERIFLRAPTTVLARVA